MHKLITILLIITATMTLAGCAGDEEMRARFPDGKVRILKDEQGRSYIVQHHIGNTYLVTPIESMFIQVPSGK